MNAPKKIWVDAELDVYDYEEQGTQPYIRADIVDELVEALTDATDAMMAFAELNRDTSKALAVLKKLEESHE